MRTEKILREYPHHVFRCYIDESGDEGYAFDPEPGRGSSPWFFLSGVVVRHTVDLEVSRSIDAIKTRLFGHLPKEKMRKPLHWRDLNHRRKRVVAEELASRQFTMVTVAVCKEKLDRATYIRDAEKLFGYTTRLLVERVSWLVDDLGGVVRFVFSNRSRFPTERLQAYMELLRASSENQVRDVFDPEEVAVRNMQQVKMLQVADACAGAAYNALVPDIYGNFETTYMRTMSARFYRYRTGRLLSYGFKIMPSSGEGYKEIVQVHPWIGEMNDW